MFMEVQEIPMFYGAPPSIIRRAYELRISMTPAEKLLWSRLRKKQVVNLRFKSQHPVNIFIVDFYCHRVKLAVELDGSIHQLPEIITKDAEREVAIKQLGIELIRFKNEEVFGNIDGVVDTIRERVIARSSL